MNDTQIISMITASQSASFGATQADTFWLMICGFLVFFMQCGFALLEAGTVRAKNTKNILLKNLLDACIGALIWFSFGYTIAYDSGGAFIGGTNGAPSVFLNGVFNENEDTTGYAAASWFFQYVFAAAAATIVSGAMAERTALTGYIVYTVVITTFIYPVVVHWGWSGDGWVSAFNSNSLLGGVVDFAGSGIVHMCGGMAAIVGAGIVGPRTGRFDEQKRPLPMPGHSTTLQVMGTMILWFGWYGFNPGSTLGMSAPNYARDAARVVVTTTMSAASGGCIVLLLEKFVGDHTWSVSAVCNGILAGLVSVTAGCSVVYPWAAMLMGFLGGFVYFGASKCVLNCLKIDDPLDAFAVHGACGFWGVLSASLFCAPAYGYGSGAGGGLFYGGGAALGAAAAFLSATIAWVISLSALMFFPLKKLGMLRVAAEVEAAGMDVSKHGGSAYGN